jgi:hydroxymethylpyrimidine pyrophosphatase-like HAD family hydrolase
LAIGDGMNDLEMLSNCGYAVAMSNAVTAVKAVADYITADNDSHGVALALEALVLGRA